MHLHVGTTARFTLGDPDPPNHVTCSVFAWLWDQTRVNLQKLLGQQIWTSAVAFCISMTNGLHRFISKIIRFTFGDPAPPNRAIYNVFAWCWDQTQIHIWDPDPPNHLTYTVYLHHFVTEPVFTFLIFLGTCEHLPFLFHFIFKILFVPVCWDQRVKQVHLTNPFFETKLRFTFGILHATLQCICMTLGAKPR